MKCATIVIMTMLVTLLASACASTQPITEPVAVIEAFHEALNDGDLDAAMSFVAADPKFITDTLYTGKAEVGGFYEEALGLDSSWELSDLRADGDKIFWTFRITMGGAVFEGSGDAVVKEGMIEFYNVLN